MASRILIAACFGIAVQAVALDARLPKPTDNAIPSPTRNFPSHITIPPSALELAKRQDVQTVLVGPDNICGYIDGRPGAAYSCNALTATCAFVSTAGLGAVACCDNNDCGLRFDCLDYDAIMTSSQCDYGCLQDTFTVKCLQTAYPYCGTVSFSNGVVDYYCDSISNSEIQSADTTWDGETDGRTFTPVEVTLDTDTATGSDAESSTATTRTRAQTTDTDTATDDVDSATATADPSATATGSDSDSSDSSSSSSSGVPAPAAAGSGGSSGTNIGPIVGGVVGGVGGLALIALLAFFLIRRSRKNKNLEQQQQQTPQQPGGYPPMQQQQQTPGGPQSVYNPAYPPQQQQQQPYGMQQQQPQNGAYPPGYNYQEPNKPGGFVTMAAAPAMVPDRNDSTSPVSQVGDNRASLQQQQQPSSPTSTVNSNYPPSQYGQQSPQQNNYSSGVPPTVHEAGSNVVGQNGWNDNHHGQFHELPGRE